MSKINALIFLTAVFLLSAGCSTMQVTPLKTGKADSYAQHEQKNGVAIGIHPITDKAEIKNLFKVNLLEKGLLPILMVAENQDPSASFIIAKEKILVVSDANATNITSQRREIASGTAGAALGITGAVLLGAGSVAAAPLVIAGAKMASDATVIQYNLADKDFYSRTLGPGGKAEGFVYFQFQKDNPPSGNHHVFVELKNATTGDATFFDFPVNLTLPKQ